MKEYNLVLIPWPGIELALRSIYSFLIAPEASNLPTKQGSLLPKVRFMPQYAKLPLSFSIQFVHSGIVIHDGFI